MNPAALSRGFTYLELVVVLAVAAIAVAIVAPRFMGFVNRTRIHAAMDRVAADVFRARLIAVENGRPVHLILRSENDCVVALQLHPVLTNPVPPMPTRRITDRSVCIRHTGDSVIVFNGRGMIRPPPRSIYVSRGAVTDSLLISIAGRVRRNYRRFRLGK